MASESALPPSEREEVDMSGDQPQDESSLVAGESPACASCRKKKSKCSRDQPCSQCVKSDVECVYDDKRSKGGIKTGVIERLAQRLDTIENMFLGQGVLLQQLLQARNADVITPSILQQPSSSFADHTDRLKNSLSTLGLDCLRRGTTPAQPSTSQSKRKRDAEPWTSSKRQEAPPSLNSALPESKSLEVVLETYFKLVHPWIPVVHPATILKRARESPRSTGVVLILNAIVAVAAPCITDQDYASVKECAGDCRRTAVASAIESGSLEALQSLLIIAFDTIKRGTSQSPWSLVATVCRKAEELQLNAEQADEKDSISNYFLTTPPSLEAATAWIEVEERRRVFWGSFLMDRFCSIATGVNPIISSKSISRRLPCDGYMWELDHAVETTFFKMHKQAHPEDTDTAEQDSPFPPAYSASEGPSGVGGLAYTIEATESLYLMTKFHSNHSEEIESSYQLSNWLNKFRQLDSKLLQWELCLTHRWREVRVVNGYIDPNLTLAHMTHNAAIIILHQRLAHPPPQARAWLSTLVSAASREACMMAAIKMNKIARRYLDASNGIPPHQFMYCLYTAGQFLLAEATHQATKPLEELGATIAALHEVSCRVGDGNPTGGDMLEIQENPASRFANSLIEQRDVPSMKTLASINKAPDQPANAAAGLQDVQLPPDLIDVPTMLQQYATSPSSGVSWLRPNLPNQGSSSNLLDENVLALTQSLMPNAKVARNISAYHAMFGNLSGQEAQGFDFMAELRSMGSLAQDNRREAHADTQQNAGEGPETSL